MRWHLLHGSAIGVATLPSVPHTQAVGRVGQSARLGALQPTGKLVVVELFDPIQLELVESVHLEQPACGRPIVDVDRVVAEQVLCVGWLRRITRQGCG